MSDFIKAYVDGNGDKMMAILEERFPDAPESTMAAVALCLIMKAPSAEKLAKLEPRLGEVVEQIKTIWVQNQW